MYLPQLQRSHASWSMGLKIKWFFFIIELDIMMKIVSMKPKLSTTLQSIYYIILYLIFKYQSLPSTYTTLITE